MHKLDEATLLNRTLLPRCLIEARNYGEDDRHVAYFQRSSGEIIHHAYGPPGSVTQTVFATDILTALNKQLHHDGAWFVVFSDYMAPRVPELQGEYRHIIVMWMDGDGDIHFPIAFEEGLQAAAAKGVDSWLMDCETAWHLWHRAMRQVLDLKENETFKRAQGQRAPTVH